MATNETEIACGYDSMVGYGYITIDTACTKNKDFLLGQTQVNVLVAVQEIVLSFGHRDGEL